MEQELSVLIVGTERESGKVLSFLKEQGISLRFHELGEENNFDAQTPVAYCETEIFKKTSNHYFLSKRN